MGLTTVLNLTPLLSPHLQKMMTAATNHNFQSRKRLYNHKCPSVRLSVHLSVRHKSKPLNSLKSSFFIIHSSSFLILHSSFNILHSSFLHFATFKLFSLFFITMYVHTLFSKLSYLFSSLFCTLFLLSFELLE